VYCEERAGMTPFTAPRWHRRVYKEPKHLTRRSTSTTNPSQASSSGRRHTCDREIMYTIKVSTRTLAVVAVTTLFRIARSSLSLSLSLFRELSAPSSARQSSLAIVNASCKRESEHGRTRRGNFDSSIMRGNASARRR